MSEVSVYFPKTMTALNLERSLSLFFFAFSFKTLSDNLFDKIQFPFAFMH